MNAPAKTCGTLVKRRPHVPPEEAYVSLCITPATFERPILGGPHHLLMEASDRQPEEVGAK